MARLRSIALTGSDAVLRDDATLVGGYSVRNTHATNAATLQLYDHASAASGTLIATVSLAAGEEVDVVYPHLKWAANGVYADFGGTGTIEGTVWVG